MFSFFGRNRNKRIYLDHAAHTPALPAVRSAMNAYWEKSSGNASALHAEGVAAKRALEEARATVAEMISAHADEIIFTSGGTEANNLALHGVVKSTAARAHGMHIVTTSFEHHSITRPLEGLVREGWSVTYVAPEPNGVMDPKKIAEAIRPDTVLVTIIAAHNELGTVQPIQEIAKAIRKKRISGTFPLFHVDACQWIGTMPLSVQNAGVDLASFNAHKMYGPSGIGALWKRRSVEIASVLAGGGQERGLRAGSENIAGAIGFAVACGEFAREGANAAECMTRLRDFLEREIVARISDAHVNGAGAARAPGILNISFDGIESEQLVIELDARGIAVSSGSACATGEGEASRAILALGMDENRAKSALRISLGRGTTDSECERLLEVLVEKVAKLRRFQTKL